MPDKKTDERVVQDRRKANWFPSRPALRTTSGGDEIRRSDRRTGNRPNQAGGTQR
jgi:hypothetical protein